MEGNNLAEAEEQKNYEVIDKRKVKIDADGEVHTAPESSETTPDEEVRSEETQAEEASAAEEEFNLPPMDVYSLLKSFVGLLGAHAWQWMGLIKNPVTGQMEKDLAQAKVAIDTISALAHQLEDKLEPSEREELRSLLSNLQINFVQQSARET